MANEVAIDIVDPEEHSNDDVLNKISEINKLIKTITKH